MRILCINPNTMPSMTEEILEGARWAAAPGTEIEAVTSLRGVDTIEGIQEDIVAALGVIEQIHIAEKSGNPPDAYIICCFGDPGLDAALEITDRPVIGIAQAAMYMAALVAPRFSIVTDPPRCIVAQHHLAGKYGMSGHLASVRCTPLTILDYELYPERGAIELAKASERAVKEDSAEAICLGCAGMVKFTQELEEKLGVPVFDGVTAAVTLAEGLVRLGKKTSKILSYQYPDKKKYIGVPEAITGKE